MYKVPRVAFFKNIFEQVYRLNYDLEKMSRYGSKVLFGLFMLLNHQLFSIRKTSIFKIIFYLISGQSYELTVGMNRL